MEKKLGRLSMIVGLILYLFDYGSDIYVAIQYWKNNEYWWFGITIGFIVVPSIIVNITAIIQLMYIWRSIQYWPFFNCPLLFATSKHLHRRNPPVSTFLQGYGIWRQSQKALHNGAFRFISCYVSGPSHHTL